MYVAVCVVEIAIACILKAPNFQNFLEGAIAMAIQCSRKLHDSLKHRQIVNPYTFCVHACIHKPVAHISSLSFVKL